MIVGSVCSGIGAPEVAWNPLGFRFAWCSEIEPFPSAVLAFRHPEVPNLGDFTKVQASAGPIDVLVGGTPCQDFSVAGLRKGLAGERGGLTVEFVRLVDRLCPRWFVWENVPGVLSIDGGRAFGTFLGSLVQLGYGLAYRILDAQWFGVPQRRRRVFVVGHLGDWRRAAEVLLEPEGLRRNPSPRREAKSGVAGSLTGSLGRRNGVPDGGDTDGQLIGTITRKYGESCGRDLENADMLVIHSLRADGFDASEDGTGRGTPLVACTLQASNGGVSSGYHPILPVAIQNATRGKDQNGLGIGEPDVPMYTLDNGSSHAVAYQCHGSNVGPMGTVRSGNAGTTGGVPFTFDERQITSNVNRTRCEPGLPCGTLHEQPHTVVSSAVRRLTPRECERLQGFPDDYTLIPYRHGKLAADGPRYKAIGNSMALPVMRWIGRRLKDVDDQIGGQP